MVHADGINVKMEGRYGTLMEELAHIVASFVRTKDFDEDDVLDAIKAGIREGLVLQDDV